MLINKCQSPSVGMLPNGIYIITANFEDGSTYTDKIVINK